MKNIRLAAFVYIMILTVSCSSIHVVFYDSDRQADLASLRTYYWLAMPEGVKIDYFLLNRIRDVVNTELKAKGLKVTTYKPDFLIAVHVETEEKQRTYTTYGTYCLRSRGASASLVYALNILWQIKFQQRRR